MHYIADAFGISCQSYPLASRLYRISTRFAFRFHYVFITFSFRFCSVSIRFRFALQTDGILWGTETGLEMEPEGF